jgi:hypothetical protein
MKGFSSLMLVRRVELLERAFGVGSGDEWIDVLMWYGRKGGVFGHVHMRISLCGRGTEWIACTDEEELAVMRCNYEKEEHKLFGKGESVVFSEYLRRFDYLGSDELADKRREIIERVRSEELRLTS